MGRGLVVLCVLQFFVSVTARAEQEAPFTDCDRYAASDSGQTKSGVLFEKIDPKAAVPACEDAIQKYPGSNRLVFELGRSYLKNGDFGAALVEFRQGAEQGYPPALNVIGTMYSNGSGVPKDEGEAVKLFRKAAEQGDVNGQLNLGFMYENGRGVPQDYSAALEWYRKAANQGSALAQDSIGYFYGAGMGVKKDDAQATAWFRKAAEQGMAGAQYNLGTMYEHGRGVSKDRSQALAWYRKSADQGNEDAKKKLIALGAEENANAPYPPDLDIAKDKMTKCLQKLPKPHDGVERQVEKVIKSYVASCGQDYMAVWRHGGLTEEQSMAAAVVDAYKVMGCRYSNPTQADMETTPQGSRSISCSPHDRAENTPAPNVVAVTARSVSVVPGAIVCPDHDTVSTVFDLYVAHWTDTQQDVMTNGQSRLLRGQPTPTPDLKFYGCVLLPPGTPMMLERGNIVPVVTAKLPDGTTIRGVTLGDMIGDQ